MSLSIIIPSYREPLLWATIQSLLDNAVGQIEVIPVLDGYKPDRAMPRDKRIVSVKFDRNRGMRAATNAGIEMAHGKYIMKLDAHCIVPHGYDREITENCEDNWILIPAKYSLHDDTMTRDELRRCVDTYFLSFPEAERPEIKYPYHLNSLSTASWRNRWGEQKIKDSMGFQGSCWVANRGFFKKQVGYLNDNPNAYGPFGCEALEIGLNYWLNGGEVKGLTSTWYAHLNKRLKHYKTGVYSRKHKRVVSRLRCYAWATKHWMSDEHGKDKPFSWLVDKFWPIPTWPDNWQEVYKSYGL